jgi:hypothetical protein
MSSSSRRSKNFRQAKSGAIIERGGEADVDAASAPAPSEGSSSSSSSKKKKSSKSRAERKEARKRRREEKRRLREARVQRKYAKLANDAQQTLIRSRSEATTILLEGLEESEWAIINDSISGIAHSSDNATQGGINTRKEHFSQRFCRWFELVSLTSLAALGILCFVYHAHRFQPPFEVCVCAERRLRDCSLLTDENDYLLVSGCVKWVGCGVGRNNRLEESRFPPRPTQSHTDTHTDAPVTLTHSLTHSDSLTDSLTHSLTDSLTHSLTH